MTDKFTCTSGLGDLDIWVVREGADGWVLHMDWAEHDTRQPLGPTNNLARLCWAITQCALYPPGTAGDEYEVRIRHGDYLFRVEPSYSSASGVFLEGSSEIYMTYEDAHRLAVKLLNSLFNNAYVAHELIDD